MNGNEFLTVSEFASRKNLSRTQVWRRIHTGRIPAERGSANGKHCYLIPADWADNYTSSGERVLAPEAETALMRVPEVAKRLGFSPEQVRRWVRSGDLPAVRNGDRGVMRIPREAVETFFKKLNNPA